MEQFLACVQKPICSGPYGECNDHTLLRLCDVFTAYSHGGVTHFSMIHFIGNFFVARQRVRSKIPSLLVFFPALLDNRPNARKDSISLRKTCHKTF